MRYEFRGLIFGGAYTWRDLFSKFYGIFGTCDELAHVHHVTTISSPELSNQIMAVQKSLCNSVKCMWQLYLKNSREDY